MWYRAASAQVAVEKIGKELISNTIRKLFQQKHQRFPSQYELGNIEKRVANTVRKRFSSLYRLRKDRLERKLSSLVEEVFEQYKGL